MPDEPAADVAPEPVVESTAASEATSGKKSKIGGVLKFILIIAIVFGVVYLFLNPEGVRGFADNYLGGLLS